MEKTASKTKRFIQEMHVDFMGGMIEVGFGYVSKSIRHHLSKRMIIISFFLEFKQHMHADKN